MRKLTYLCMTMLVLVWSSCKKDDTTSPSTPDLEAFSEILMENKEITLKAIGGENFTSVEWDFGDGQKATGLEVKHTYAVAGDYTVKLNATHASGDKSLTVPVSIKEFIVEIQTSHGSMFMYLHPQTKLHRANFLKLSREKFFDGSTFHRIIKDFVIQGGDPNSKDSDPSNDGMGGPGYTIPAEILPDLKHVYGAVGAARQGNSVNPERKSNGSQFYVVTNQQGTPHLNNEYTVFGQIIKGMEVAKVIEVQPKGTGDRPLTDIKMTVLVHEKTKAEILSDYGFEIK